MSSNFLKTLRIICRIEQDNTSYRELIEFFYGETPPEDNNFLRDDYTSYIENVTKFGSNKKNVVLFSIIVPTYNRRDLLLKTVNAVIGQKNISLDEFEIVIIDNGSKDKTEKAVEDFADQNRQTSMVYIKLKKNYGADLARNVAVLNSQGNLLAFTDDDCIVPPDWLFEFKRELEANPEIAGVGGFKEPWPIKPPLDIYHRFTMWKHFYRTHVRTKNFDILNNQCGLTANVCYRREIFEKLGGFNPYFKHVGFMEFKIRARKLGLKLLYEPKMVKHFADFSLGIHIKKCLLQGLDWHFLYLLHPDIRQNPDFLFFLKRTINDSKIIFTSRSQPPLFSKSIPDMVRFSFVSIVTNFFLWFGKYWLVAFG
ncbi:MAG: glycosyltransferase family 2 protein [bacterium]|nr:glycosyltransferase family 2 protein [bacterium]